MGGASVSELVRLGGLWAVHRFLNLCSFSARFCGQCLGGLWAGSQVQLVLTVHFVRLGLLAEKSAVKRMSMTRLEGGLVAL